VIDLDRIDFAKGDGVVTVVCQDALSGAVLMVAHGNRESLERTVETGEMHYWSRSRGLWHKGSTSGNRQAVVELRYDCDGDAILARVSPSGPACHTGSASCFGSLGDAGGILERLDAVIERRAGLSGGDAERHQSDAGASESTQSRAPGSGNNPTGFSEPHRSHAPDIVSPPSYTARLLRDRNLRLKKIGEEAAEFVTACADGDADRACGEAADLIYHTLVALRAAGASLRDVERVLDRRHAASSH
jgi:phosphoribosyl-ATP pyrophosphohydrolase/phosphoribosyl-AMP cyclohydrolase